MWKWAVGHELGRMLGGESEEWPVDLISSTIMNGS